MWHLKPNTNMLSNKQFMIGAETATDQQVFKYLKESLKDFTIVIGNGYMDVSRDSEVKRYKIVKKEADLVYLKEI